MKKEKQASRTGIPARYRLNLDRIATDTLRRDNKRARARAFKNVFQWIAQTVKTTVAKSDLASSQHRNHRPNLKQ